MSWVIWRAGNMSDQGGEIISVNFRSCQQKMPKSKLEREFPVSEDGTVVMPKELVPEQKISRSAIKSAIKRPLSEKQQENLAKLVEANKKRWAALREAKEKQSAEALSAVKQEEEKLIEQGTHVRLKVREKVEKPRKVKEKVEEIPPVVEAPKPIQKPQKKKHSRYTTDSSDDETTETETETEVEDSDDEPLPPRRAVRQARRAVRTLQKIDEVIEHASNPYMSKLMNRWR